MSDEDKDQFSIDIKTLDWEDYFTNMAMGVRRYLNNEQDKNLPAARKKDNMWVMIWLEIWKVILMNFVFRFQFTHPAFTSTNGNSHWNVVADFADLGCSNAQMHSGTSSILLCIRNLVKFPNAFCNSQQSKNYLFTSYNRRIFNSFQIFNSIGALVFNPLHNGYLLIRISLSGKSNFDGSF